ncbi:MAG: 5'/3'-nucleotidase SurE [Bacteroidales bacterium]|nr:5'/3'-nucleotidase SurE [Bacteroidales bacterium]
MQKKTERLILVTNDDGINAKGLEALIEAVEPFGKLLIVAPEDPNSGMSHAITVKVPLRIKLIKNNDIKSYYTCTGTPVDCVKMAMTVILDKKPDLIVSGINHGSNSAASIFYSGTMAAALEGSMIGIPSIGFSLTNHSHQADFSACKKYISIIVENTLQHKMPEGVALNVNIPDVPEKDIKGIRICRQTKGYWKEEFEKRVDPSRGTYYWLAGDFINFEPDAEDTDEWALANNYVSIVPVSVDLTAYTSLEYLKKMSF